MNPIVKKELKISGRSGNIPMLIVCFNAVLFLTGLFLLYGSLKGMQETGSMNYRQGMVSCSFVALLLLFLVLFLFPGRTVTAISQERDSGTFDLLRASGLSPLRIIFGKFLTEWIFSAAVLLSCLPALSLPMIFGGTDMILLLALIGLLMITAAFALSVGLFGSAHKRQRTSGAMVSLSFILLFTAGPFLLAFLARPFFGAGGNVFVWLFLLSPILPVCLLELVMTGQEAILAKVFTWFSFEGAMPGAEKMLLWSVLASVLLTVIFFFAAVRASKQ